MLLKGGIILLSLPQAAAFRVASKLECPKETFNVRLSEIFEAQKGVD
jgi:hypothetical protein